jgi:hypothetical protein
VTAGRQFDRTANVWIGGVNVYFGTTAEPSRAVARSWHVERDLTDYQALLRSAQAGRVDLGNLVNTTYTGILHGTARLQIYPAGDDDRDDRGERRQDDERAHAPDLVLPLSADATGGTVGLNTTQSALARSFTLPRNVERVFLDVIAQSQSGDEFWYTCVPDDVAGALQSCGATGFREGQVSIDGQPAGVAPIFPWIYTGGIDPYLWRPIPGVQTLSFRPWRVDLTPFAFLLADGQPHQIALSVFNANGYFSATATLLVVLDHGSREVRGGLLRNTLSAAPAPTVDEALTTAADGSISGTVTVASHRRYAVRGWLHTSHGRVETEVEQAIDFSNAQTFRVDAADYLQQIDQSTSVITETRREGAFGRRSELRKDRWPLKVAIAALTAADGSSSQATTIEQRLGLEQISFRGGWPVAFHVEESAVAPTDTLAFDSAGNFLGPQGDVNTHRYFSAGSGEACYSRTISAAGGLLTAVTDGAECR